MVTEQEVEELKQAKWLWGRLVEIQCTKPPDVVKRTAELLPEAKPSDVVKRTVELGGCDQERKRLKGQ